MNCSTITVKRGLNSQLVLAILTVIGLQEANFLFKSKSVIYTKGFAMPESIQGAGLDQSVKLKINFLITQPKHMLWVLKRTVSMRRFF